MKRTLILLPLLVAFLHCPVSGAERGKTVTVLKTPSKTPVIRVEYPCHLHQNVSVEVRILSAETRENLSLTKPLYFNRDWLPTLDPRGVHVRDVVDSCYLGDDDDYILRELEFLHPDARESEERRESMNNARVEMKVLGWKNVFEKREVMVQMILENPRTERDEVTQVYPVATHCRVGIPPTPDAPFNAHAFGFELLGKEFDAPCDVVVWVLRDAEILVQEVVHWPGH